MTDPSTTSPHIRQIVLTGFMGSGKSTVGPLLAARLRWQFIDADDAIVAEGRLSIPEIFAHHGEPAFRQREHETIARLIATDSLVLALGGGAIETAATRDLLPRQSQHASSISKSYSKLPHLLQREPNPSVPYSPMPPTSAPAMRNAFRSIAWRIIPSLSTRSHRKKSCRPSSRASNSRKHSHRPRCLSRQASPVSKNLHHHLWERE